MDLPELKKRFAMFDDWKERYQYIIDLGKKLPGLPESDMSEDNRVHGCMSQVWLTHTVDGETYTFHGDSDAAIVRGLVAVLLGIYSGKTAAEIEAVDLDCIFADLGLGEHLSPNRRNGFVSMVGRIQSIAKG